jgi:hypothetical protein
MFPNGRHVFLSLASAPHDSRVAACLIEVTAIGQPIPGDLP